MSKGINRRNFVRYTSAAAAGLGVAGCMGIGDTDESGAASDDTLEEGERPVKWMGPAWAVRDGQKNKFEEMTDVELETVNVANPQVQQRAFSGSAENMDAVSVDIAFAGALIDNDAMESTSADNLENWNPDLISDLFMNPTERLSHIEKQAERIENFLWADKDANELQFPPHVYNFDAVGYNPKAVDDENTWGSLFDDQYQGRVAFGSSSTITAPEVMMYMKDEDLLDVGPGEINNPTEDQIDALIEFLIKEKQAGQFRSTWTAYGNSVNLMASEEAIIGNIWQPAAFDIRRSGTPCTYATMSDGVQGYRSWYGGIAPFSPGATNRNNLAEVRTLLDNVHYGAWFPRYIAGWGYSVPHYPNKDLVRTGSDDSGEGMGPEYYDWAYEGEATYTPISETQFESEAMFDPQEYDWSMEEGTPADGGSVRDSGPIEERINRIGAYHNWPDNAEYLVQEWRDFESA